MENYTSYKSLIPYTKRDIEDWGGVTSKDYNSFQTKYRNFLKRLCTNNGYELVNFLKGHYQFSCFIKDPATGKFIYIFISDTRYFKNSWYNNILIRTAQHEKDYRGGSNDYTSLAKLEDKIKRMFSY